MIILGSFVGFLITSSFNAEAWMSPSSRKNTRISLGATAASNNNVVLRPSENPEAFDSLKIGSAKIHRYQKDTTGDGAAEYIMWYHGRSKNFKDDESLPQLSTGRVGRAVSRNGLQWEKVTEGSLSEDLSDVSLGLNKESWWGFDTSHVGLGQVLLPMSTPAVMTPGGVYIMYYMGGNFEETSVADYLNDAPDSKKNEKIKGMKMRIGVAISQDGIAWGRVEGDDPTGACVVPYDKDDSNAEPIKDGNNNLLKIEEELYCGWPEVAVRINKKEESRFFMYYSTMTKENKQRCIACAVSPDGFKWTKQGTCIQPDSGDGMDAGGCARCNVLTKASFQDGTWSEQDGWIMFYEGVSTEDKKHRIMMAESKDGLRWEKKGIVFDVGTGDDDWDSGGVGAPHIIRLDDGSMRMYYTGQAKDGTTAIGAARLYVGEEPTKWAREQAEFVLN